MPNNRNQNIIPIPMATATWNGTVIVQSDATIVIEGNHYFPPTSVHKKFLKPSSSHTTCPWKGEASYYDLVVNGQTNKDAAWYYPKPNKSAIARVGKDFSNYIAFWKVVEIED